MQFCWIALFYSSWNRKCLPYQCFFINVSFQMHLSERRLIFRQRRETQGPGGSSFQYGNSRILLFFEMESLCLIFVRFSSYLSSFLDVSLFIVFIRCPLERKRCWRGETWVSLIVFSSFTQQDCYPTLSRTFTVTVHNKSVYFIYHFVNTRTKAENVLLFSVLWSVMSTKA